MTSSVAYDIVTPSTSLFPPEKPPRAHEPQYEHVLTPSTAPRPKTHHLRHLQNHVHFQTYNSNSYPLDLNSTAEEMQILSSAEISGNNQVPPPPMPLSMTTSSSVNSFESGLPPSAGLKPTLRRYQSVPSPPAPPLPPKKTPLSQPSQLMPFSTQTRPITTLVSGRKVMPSALFQPIEAANHHQNAENTIFNHQSLKQYNYLDV